MKKRINKRSKKANLVGKVRNYGSTTFLSGRRYSNGRMSKKRKKSIFGLFK